MEAVFIKIKITRTHIYAQKDLRAQAHTHIRTRAGTCVYFACTQLCITVFSYLCTYV